MLDTAPKMVMALLALPTLATAATNLGCAEWAHCSDVMSQQLDGDALVKSHPTWPNGFMAFREPGLVSLRGTLFAFTEASSRSRCSIRSGFSTRDGVWASG